jgi:uncharacterized protein YecT (DUF1311 family)
MSIGEVSFYTGIILLFIGILGGGIEIKELKIPQITGAPRYMCFIGSILLLILGLYLKHEIPAITIMNASNPTVSSTPEPKVADVPVVPAQQAQPATPPVESDKAIAAKHQALVQLDEANKRINVVWNATTQEIRDALLAEQNQWLKQREDDCSVKASNEQPVDTVMQEAVKLTCMAAMTDPRMEVLKQKIAATQSVVTDDHENTPEIATLTPSVNSSSINDVQKEGSDKALSAKNQAQAQLDEANKRINVVWNATTQEIREALLPEQRQWLKQREDDCSLKASNEQPDDKVMQETFKLNCMAAITDPRTEELKQKIAAMSQ